MARVQSASNNSAAAGTTAPLAIWPAATTAGNILVCGIGCRSTATGLPTITMPAPWVALTPHGETGAGNTDPGTRLFYILNASPRSLTETGTLSASADWGMWLAEYVANSSWSLDVEAGAASSANANPADAGTTAALAQANEIVIALIANKDQSKTQNGAPADGFTQVGATSTSDATPSNGVTVGLYENLAHAASAAHCTVSVSVAKSNSGCTVAFKTASGPVNTVAPVISGNAYVGQVLTSTTGSWTGTGAITYAYQWQRAGVNIGGATSSTYTLVSADVGNAITCVVTATDNVGSTSQSSNALTAGPSYTATANMKVEFCDFATVVYTPGGNPPSNVGRYRKRGSQRLSRTAYRYAIYPRD